jgi:AbrB family looped-hinge helix DNA binding protein
VIPAAIRRRARLEPGSELEIRLEEDGIRIRRLVPAPRVVSRKGRQIVEPTVPYEACPEVDVPELIREERERWPW